jgi:hypothetical protein
LPHARCNTTKTPRFPGCMKYGDFETWCFAILGGLPPPRFRFAIASGVSRKDDLKNTR